MSRPAHTVLALVFVALALALPPGSGRSAPPLPGEPRIDLGKLYLETAAGPRVAPEVEALRSRRVRAAGYMVRMEDAPRGALYLTRSPVDAEEGGAGTGDLPPGALRVEVPRLAGQEIAWVAGPLEVVGRLEEGRAEDDDGRVSWLRLVVDDPPPAAHP